MFLEDWLDLPRTIARFDRVSARVDRPNNASNVSILRGWIVSLDRGATRGVRGYRRRETSIVAGLRKEKSGASWRRMTSCYVGISGRTCGF